MKRGRPRKGEVRVKLTKPDHRCYHGLRMWTVAGHDLDVLRLHRDEWGVVTSCGRSRETIRPQSIVGQGWRGATLKSRDSVQVAVLPVRDA